MEGSDEKVCVLCAAGFPHPATDLCTTEADSIKEAVPKQRESEVFADAESTGRKRAAILLPTEQLSSMRCEWAELAEAGGGLYPIKGCQGNLATDRHHGPDKNTLNNERFVNLHAICAYCHNRWHTANDETYEGERPSNASPWLPIGDWKAHNPTKKMSKKESLIEELKRQV